MASTPNNNYQEIILVVDDAPDTLEIVRRNLQAQNYKVYTATKVSEAIELLKAIPVALVITDLKMPEVSGMDLVRHVRENYNNTEVMMFTGYASIEGAIQAVKLGAEEYLPKPFTDEELFAAVARALQKYRQKKPQQKMLVRLKSSCGLLGNSAVMQQIYRTITKAAAALATVLISGESGTGKELIARAIHYNGPRASAPFVPINCGGIPEGLLESELFGYVQGAFTGASHTRPGFFQTAEGGTIFLDEISETSLAMQVKLLRVLQGKEICMVGSTKLLRVDARIIAATNKNLLDLVQKGAFREDLYYRLNVINIEVPPLRLRQDDIPLLIAHFVDKFSKELGKSKPQLSSNALQALQGYAWPGNVRELENIIQRMVVMKETQEIDTPDLPPWLRFNAWKSPALNRKLCEVEAQHILNVLKAVDGNKSRAAEILGIDRKTLREKLKKARAVEQGISDQ